MNCGSSGSAGEKVAPAWADSPRAEPGAADPESRSSPAARRPARGQALKGETPWPIWGVERTISGAQSSPHPLILRERSWENLMGGGGVIVPASPGSSRLADSRPGTAAWRPR